MAHVHNRNGSVLVEVLLAISLLGIFVSIGVEGLLSGARGSIDAAHYRRGVLLAQEGMEAARNIRDDSFAALVDGTYGVSVAGGEWVLSGSSDTNGIFTRSVAIQTTGSNRKAVTATVDWSSDVGDGSVVISGLLTFWREVVAGIGDWSLPSEEGSENISGNQNGLRVRVSGDYAYVVRSGGNPDFVVVDISDTANPSVVGDIALSGTPTDVWVMGDYAFVSSNDNSSEVQIIDISTPASPTQVGSYNASGNQDALAIGGGGDYVYTIRSTGFFSEFLAIDVSVPASPSLIGSTTVFSPTDVWVSGDYAYVASSSGAAPLQVVDITTPSSPVVVGSVSGAGGISISHSADTDVVAIGTSGGDVYLYDVSVPASPSLLSSFDASDDVNDLDFGNGGNYLFIASNENSAELQIWDITTVGSPVLLGSLNHSSDLNGVDYDDVSDRAVSVGDENGAEFVVFMPN